MLFDVVIGNPPYQKVVDSRVGGGSIAIYSYFWEMALRLKAIKIIIIIPARWFTGGRGLRNFKSNILSDNKISKIVYYKNASDIFPTVNISGGISILYRNSLKDSSLGHKIQYIEHPLDDKHTEIRDLNQYDIFISDSTMNTIITKVQDKMDEYDDIVLSNIVCKIGEWGISSSYNNNIIPFNNKDLYKVVTSRSKKVSYIDKANLAREPKQGYRVAISRISSEHAGESDKQGKYRVLSNNIQVIDARTVVTESYIELGLDGFMDIRYANRLVIYLKTKFLRSILKTCQVGIHFSKETFKFIPLVDLVGTNLNDITMNSDGGPDWSYIEQSGDSVKALDNYLYWRYGLNSKEQDYIENMIK